MSKPQSLERLLQGQGFASRKGSRQMIEAGRVKVNGELCRQPGALFIGEGLCLEVDGQSWPWREKLYIALNKPEGYECSRSPQHHRPVLSLLPPQFAERGVQPIGRLDEQTTGLLLLSDDGAWAHALNAPRKHVAKTYHAHCKHPISNDQIAALLGGVMLHGEAESTAALACRQLDSHILELVIDQGKYHQVRRMVAAVGNRVEGLQRVAVGGLSLLDGPLQDLPSGQWRELDELALGLCRSGFSPT